MKTQLLKITSLVMMVIATVVVYAYNPEHYEEPFTCPDNLGWNPDTAQCEEMADGDEPRKATAISYNLFLGVHTVICWEKKGKTCTFTYKSNYTLNLKGSENAF